MASTPASRRPSRDACRPCLSVVRRIAVAAARALGDTSALLPDGARAPAGDLVVPSHPQFPMTLRFRPPASLAFLLALATALAAGPASAQGEAAPASAPATTQDVARDVDARLGMHAERLRPGERIALDGTLSDPAWQRAPVYNQFTEKDPVNAAKPKYETRVQVLFDGEAIYVGVTALDDHPEEIRAPLVRHDAVSRTQDFVFVIIDSIGKRQAGQFFRVNAAGSTGDGLYTAADDNEDFSPDFDYDAAAARNAQGWTGVFRIPFSSLRFSSDASAGWRIMVGRRVPRDQFYLWTSVPVPLDAPAFISTLQPLQDLAPPAKPNFLIVRPSVTVRQSRTNDLGGAPTRENAIDPSLDVKWHPAPELVLDGTWRPDFSQVALDVPQLSGNSSFALYLPEKRPFFFESSDILRSPSEALYTRSFTAPQWGVRGTWRGQSVSGTAMAIDDRGGGQTLLPNAYGTSTADQPASRSLTVRARGDVGSGNDLEVGGLASIRKYDFGDGDNNVYGPDVTWQVTPLWKLRGQWLHSETTAQPAFQADTGRVVLRDGASSSGDFVTLRANRQSDSLSLDAELFDSSPQFRHDSGFFNQVGVREIDLHQGFAWRQLGPINELWLNLNEAQITDRVNHDVVLEYLTPGFWLAAANNTQISLQYRGFSKLRTWQGAPLIGEHYWRGEFSTTPARWIPQANLEVNLGRMADYYSGVVRPGGQVNLSLATRPLARIELEPRVSYAWLNRGTQRVYREVASQLLGVYHIDARQNVRVILQRYTYDHKEDFGNANGDYGARESQFVASVTYAFRKSMGSVLYVGWTNGRTLDCPASSLHPGVDSVCRAMTGSAAGTGSLARQSEVFVKLQADFDEVKRMF
jgi:hypothetical protein